MDILVTTIIDVVRWNIFRYLLIKRIISLLKLSIIYKLQAINYQNFEI
ncbi:MAG: hypothetical protein HPY66_2547 [Firmicutes bacterium]|nr:hypothetical protein [Bacillota bacterium]